MAIPTELLQPRHNNLTLVRLVLASAVIVTHAYWRVTGVGGKDDFSFLLGAPLSEYAVDGFFFLSGFLVYQSLQRRPNVGNFMIARLARMVPALLASTLGTVAIGALVTNAPMSTFAASAVQFLAKNLLFIGGEYSLAGISCGGAPCVLNGSLWTLPWEMRCYLGLAALALLGLASPRWMVRLILPATLVFAVLWNLPGIEEFVGANFGSTAVYFLSMIDRLWTLFAAGAAASIFRDRIPLSWLLLIALSALSIAVSAAGFDTHIKTIFVSYAVLCFGFLSARKGAISGTWPDYSYGMYIYAFPVMMAAAAIWPFQNYYLLALVNALLTLPLAIISWHFIEKPCLSASGRLRFKERKADTPAGKAG